jgi:putative toxin-antitoxin system antitoxin component (TIGR02293 family)
MAERGSLSEAAAVLDQLGGNEVFLQLPSTLLEIHALIRRGFPIRALKCFADELAPTNRVKLLADLGVTQRTMKRRLHNQGLLSPQESARIWTLAQAFSRAVAVMGDRVAAECWMTRVLAALGHESPSELMTTPVGDAMVEDYLGRLEYAVYT